MTDPVPDFAVHADKLVRVINGLRGRDIGDCLTGDVRHAAAVLTWMANIEIFWPGTLAEILDDTIPLVLERMNQTNLLYSLADAAAEDGWGAEFERILDADQGPDQNLATLRRCEFLMRAFSFSQSEAIRWMARHRGKKEDTLRRAITRAKATGNTHHGK